MSELSEYQLQVAKLKRWNRLIVTGTAGFIILLFVACIAYAVWSTSQTRNQTTEIVKYINDSKATGSVEAAVTREGGDIIRCILNIPPLTRSQPDIDKCYPGGSQEAWLKMRDEALKNGQQ